MDNRFFPESEQLKDIVERHNLLLLDVTKYSVMDAPCDWEELSTRPPAQLYELNRQYLFSPKPAKGQTLLAAYSVTKGLGPSLWIPDVTAHKDMDGGGPLSIDGNLVYLFTRLIFSEDRVIATSPRVRMMRRPPIVEILNRVVLEKFQKYFRITTQEEIDRQKIFDVEKMTAPGVN